MQECSNTYIVHSAVEDDPATPASIVFGHYSRVSHVDIQHRLLLEILPSAASNTFPILRDT